MKIRSSLDAVKNADRLVDVLRLADDLAVEASRDTGVRNIRLLLTAIASEDQITAIAAIHAISNIQDEDADNALAELLLSDQKFVRQHAAWALNTRAPRPKAVSRLIDLIIPGGFSGMVAQRTLENWSETMPVAIAVGLESALLGVHNIGARYRLVETLGLVQNHIAAGTLARIALSESEDVAVRIAATAALGEHPETPQVSEILESLAEAGGELGETAQLALFDLAHLDRKPEDGGTAFSNGAGSTSDGGPSTSEGGTSDFEGGITVAQLFLHADIDPELREVGSGENGGIATLLVRLGDALVDGSASSSPDRRSAGSQSTDTIPVKRVLTLSRGSAADALESTCTLMNSSSSHLYGSIPLLPSSVQPANPWSLRVATRRGITRLLRSACRVDVIHLRMADVGSLVAFDVARRLDIPVVFTAAPDPHGLLNSMDLSGKLTRFNFGKIDEDEHFWFRARLVQRLAANSAHTVLFPRPNLQRDMKNLVGIDVVKDPEKHSTVPEGIDLTVVDQSVVEARALAAGGSASPQLAELMDLLRQLPVGRQGLPLLVSVGRFHRVKGMATIVEAWAGSDLRRRTNLLLVGGNLKNPSANEREQLDLINALINKEERLKEGLILPGHLPNSTVARWVAAAYAGVPGLAAPNGVYVCGSMKEEFGLALLEAMASGLIVVAPTGGGPSTYIEQGRTGFLTTTWDIEKFRGAIEAALAAAQAEEDRQRAEHSRSVVEKDFTVAAMAHALTEVYSDVYRDDVQLREELVPLL